MQNLIGSKPLIIRFVKINKFIRIYDEARYLVLFEPEKYDASFNRIRCLMVKKVLLPISFLIILQK